MRRRYLIITLLMAVVLIFAATQAGLADAFGFSGDSDWGGSSDWGSSDWGSSDWGSSSDWSSDSDWSTGSGSTFFIGGGNSLFFIVAVIVILAAILLKGKNKKSGGAKRPAGVPFSTPVTSCDLSPMREKDPNFSESRFIEKVSNLYVQMQNAWQAKNPESMRPYMTDTLYGRFARQLDPFIQNRQTNHVDRITVMSAIPTALRFDEQNAIITVRLSTRIVDYVTDDKTGNIVRGSNTKELFMTYDWTLIRDKNIVTPLDEKIGMVTCPNCGASVEINYSAKCPYCDTVLTANNYDWCISDIKGVSQRGA